MRFASLVCLVSASLMAGSVSANTPQVPGKAKPQLFAEPDAWLGVGFAGGAGSSYVRINEVIRDTPADIAGIVVGDFIIGINGEKVLDGDHLQKLIRAHKVGESIKVSVRRGSQIMNVSTELTGKLDPSELIKRRLVDNQALPFSMMRLHGDHPADLKQLRDKVVILEFWSTTCRGCEKTLEPLANFEAENSGDAVVLLITPESPSAIASYLKSYSLPFTVLQDMQSRMKRLYFAELTGPTVVVIGRDGIVRHADTGPDLNIHDAVLQAKRTLRESSSI